MDALITSAPTDGQLKQCRRLFEDTNERALKEILRDKDAMQMLLEHGGEFQMRMFTIVRELTVSNQFADEEVESGYGYLSGYKPLPIAEQVNMLQELFPGIGPANLALAEQPLPEGAEGYMAIPRWEKVAATYGEALEKVLALIYKMRKGKFTNYRENELGPDRLRQHARSLAFWKQIGEQQTGFDILIIPAQFGIRHRGKSVRRAREVFRGDEFGLGAFATGCMLLTNPVRLLNLNDLWVDCAGDEYGSDADGAFHSAPCFGFPDGEVKFGTRWVSRTYDRYGSASAFFPQQ